MKASLLAFLARVFIGANVRWSGFNPDFRQRIYFANHTSHLDSLVLWSILPPDVRRMTRPVAARDYWETGLRNVLATRVFNAVLIERKKVTAACNPITQMIEALEDGSSLILFPEGTRGGGEEISPFKSGLYHLARRRPSLEFVPVYIDNLNRILPKGEVLPVPLLCHVTFGKPIRLIEAEVREEFLNRAHAALCELRGP